MEENNIYKIILRHDTSTNWMINNPTLDLGEYGVEDDTHRIKRGDGETSWENLTYETFGIDKMLILNTSNIEYDNSVSGLEQTTMQDVIDYLAEVDKGTIEELKDKEDKLNKKTDFESMDDDSYPTTKAVADYVTKQLDDINTSGCDCTIKIPEIPDQDNSYMLYCNQGVLEWRASTSSAEGLEQTVKDLQQQVKDLQQKLDNILNLDEEEF